MATREVKQKKEFDLAEKIREISSYGMSLAFPGLKNLLEENGVAFEEVEIIRAVNQLIEKGVFTISVRSILISGRKEFVLVRMP